MKWSQQLAYLGCSLSLGVFSAFNNFTLSLWLTGFTSSHILISLLGNTRSLEGAVVSPLAGAWSDRVWLGWLGRRRPFILSGGLLSALLLALTPAMSRWPLPFELDWLDPDIRRLVPIVLAVFAFTLTFNLMDDIHHSLLADLTDGAEQNRLSALATVTNIGSNFGLLLLGYWLWNNEVPDSAFAITGVLVAIGVIWTVLGIQEPPPGIWAGTNNRDALAGQPPTSSSTPGQDPPLSVWGLLRDYRGAAIFCLVSFFYWSGVNAVLPLVSIFTRDILKTSLGEAQLLPGLLMVSTATLAVPMAWLGTHLGKKRVISAGYLIMAIAALFGMVISTREQGAALFVFAGIGNSAVVVLAIPILADLVPRQHMGAAAGFLAAGGSLAAPLSSFVAGGLTDYFGPRSIFAVMAVTAVIAVALMPLVAAWAPPAPASESGQPDQPRSPSAEAQTVG